MGRGLGWDSERRGSWVLLVWRGFIGSEDFGFFFK